MSPEVEAALIAAGVGILTFFGAFYGTRKTSRDTKDALNQQLQEQGEQLDKTLKAQSDQLDRTLAEQRTRTLNERFATAAEQLGSDKPAVRLAGVYAMAGLADDWEENRQTCVDVLCASLRLPHDPDLGTEDALDERAAAYRAGREVRHTVIRVVVAHLKDDAALSWRGLNFDFTGVIFDGGDFSGAEFSSGLAIFDGAVFPGGEVRFSTVFSGGEVYFTDGGFTGGKVSFPEAQFIGGLVSFNHVSFAGGEVSFPEASFDDGEVTFVRAAFSGSEVDFDRASFGGGQVDFGDAFFRGGQVDFGRAEFFGSEVDFGARFWGGTVSFKRARFSGGTVDFSDAGDWSCPPVFPWTDTPPSCVELPGKEDHSQA